MERNGWRCGEDAVGVVLEEGVEETVEGEIEAGMVSWWVVCGEFWGWSMRVGLKGDDRRGR